MILLYLSSLFYELTTHYPSSWIPSYIDDVAIVVQSKSKAYNARCLEAAARTAFKWAENNAVRFDDSKSEMMHFHNKQNSDTTDDEKIILPNGTTISPGTKGIGPDMVRWIGIWFDRKINFKHHVMLKAASGKRALGALKSLANTESGLTPSAVRQLYNACVVPVCDFGAEVWWMGQAAYQQKFETVQNMALRCILGASRTTPTIALHNESALPPVAVRLNHMRRKYAIRILTFPEMHPI